MKQQQQNIRGFFHRFTREGKSEESAQASPPLLGSPVPRDSSEATVATMTPPTTTTLTTSKTMSMSMTLLDIPTTNARSRQVSEASSVGSKRSRDEGVDATHDDDDDDDHHHHQTPKIRKISGPTVNLHNNHQLSKSLNISSPSTTYKTYTIDDADVPRSSIEAAAEKQAYIPSSSSLSMLSHTPSAASRSQQTVVRSSHDSDEADALLEPIAEPTAEPTAESTPQPTPYPAPDLAELDTTDDNGSDSDASLIILRGFTPKHKKQPVKSRSASPKSSLQRPEKRAMTPVTTKKTRTGVGTIGRQNYFEPAFFKKLDEAERNRQADEAQLTPRLSLAKMARQRQREEAKQLEVARHRQTLEIAMQEREVALDAGDENWRDSALESLGDGRADDGNVHRLKVAMGRTQASGHSDNWHFFDRGPDAQILHNPAEFPAWQVIEEPLLCHLSDPSLREHSFLTGFAADCITRGSCPDDLQQWLWASAMSEPRQDLARAYLEAFEACVQTKDGTVDDKFVNESFETIGASETAVAVSSELKADRGRDGKVDSTKAQSLLPVMMDCFANMATRISTQTKTCILRILLKMGADAELIAVSKVRFSLQTCIEVLVASLDDGDSALAELSSGLFTNVQNATLRARLVSSVPETSPRLGQFKRRLALAWLLDDGAWLQTNSTRFLQVTKEVTTKLAAMNVRDESTDFATVAAQVLLADISIGGGYEAAEDGEQRDVFDAAVDALSGSVKQLFARIVDNKANDMARTEVKGSLERLQYRLDFAVRTKAPAKLNIYEEVMTRRGLLPDRRSVAVMSSFVQREPDGLRRAVGAAGGLF